ncbi:hypothetical protein ACWCXH_25810 [Kitasatospora sp. NPDC001660]
MSRRTIPVAAVLVLASAVIAGCSSGSGGQSASGGGPPGGQAGTGAAGAPAVTATPTPTSASDLTALPLRAFVPSDDEAKTLNKAEGLLAQDCMHRLGFGTWQPPATGPTAKSADIADQYGYLDEAQAAQYGFRSAAGVKGKPTDGPKLDPAQFTAETGATSVTDSKQVGGNIPDGGCFGEAGRKLDEGLTKPAGSVYEDLMSESYQRTNVDPRVVAGIKTWADCMKQKGYSYSSPQALSAESWGATVTQREIDTAKADVACTKQTNLPGIAFGVQSAIQQQQIAQHQQQLKAQRDFVDARLRKAAEVLRSRGQ